MTIYLISWNLLVFGKNRNHTEGFFHKKVSESAAVVQLFALLELMKLQPFGLRLEFKGPP